MLAPCIRCHMIRDATAGLMCRFFRLDWARVPAHWSPLLSAPAMGVRRQRRSRVPAHWSRQRHLLACSQQQLVSDISSRALLFFSFFLLLFSLFFCTRACPRDRDGAAAAAACFCCVVVLLLLLPFWLCTCWATFPLVLAWIPCEPPRFVRTPTNTKPRMRAGIIRNQI
jgi:hypothetical protein